jgi:hypothetical protein
VGTIVFAKLDKRKVIAAGHAHWALKIGHWRTGKAGREPFSCGSNGQFPMPNLFSNETQAE